MRNRKGVSLLNSPNRLNLNKNQTRILAIFLNAKIGTMTKGIANLAAPSIKLSLRLKKSKIYIYSIWLKFFPRKGTCAGHHPFCGRFILQEGSHSA